MIKLIPNNIFISCENDNNTFNENNIFIMGWIILKIKVIFYLFKKLWKHGLFGNFESINIIKYCKFIFNNLSFFNFKYF